MPEETVFTAPRRRARAEETRRFGERLTPPPAPRREPVFSPLDEEAALREAPPLGEAPHPGEAPPLGEAPLPAAEDEDAPIVVRREDGPKDGAQ